MTKRVRAKQKISRSLGVNLWGRANASIIKRNYPPGHHLGKRRYGSDYGKHLQEKQRLRKYYHITEKQFSAIYKEAARMKGDTGENLIGLLETRLASLVYRANFVPTIFAARQLVNHKHVIVNDKKVNVSNYFLKIGEVVQIANKSQQIPMVLEATQKGEREVPDYIAVDYKKMTASLTRIPKLADVPYPFVIDINLIIEYYSR